MTTTTHDPAFHVVRAGIATAGILIVGGGRTLAVVADHLSADECIAVVNSLVEARDAA